MMHRYAVHTSKEEKVPLYLAFFAVCLSFGLSKLLEMFGFVPPWWSEAPTVMTCYGIIYHLFDRYFWHTRAAHLLGLVDIPNVTGVWRGTLTTSFDEHATPTEATAHVTQTWSRILIRLSTANSKSTSEAATIVCEPGVDALLIYEYLNEPTTGAVATMHTHRGTARLALEKSLAHEKLAGEYYTGRDRQSYGRLDLRRLA